MDHHGGKVVLLIEDHPSIRQLISIVLERSDIRLVFAPDGLSGLEAIDAYEPDLVLLDLLLPDINGWEVLEWVRSRRSATDMPVLIVTAYGGDGDEFKAFERGANGYLPKPFDNAALRDIVDRLLGGCLA